MCNSDKKIRSDLDAKVDTANIHTREERMKFPTLLCRHKGQVLLFIHRKDESKFCSFVENDNP